MGCAPAYLALAVEALADAGADAGLDPELARELVVETAAGTAELLRAPPPGRRAQAVASPGGSTEAGLEALEARGRPRGLRGAPCSASLERMRGLVISLAIARGDVADYVDALFLVYIDPDLRQHPDLAGCRGMPYNRALRAVLDFVNETTDPYLNIFRRFCRRRRRRHRARPQPDRRRDRRSSIVRRSSSA